MGSLADAAFAPRALQRAWQDVLSGGREDGTIGPAVARFQENAEDRLTRLGTDLAWGTYTADDLSEVALEEPARTRRLHVPTVRDRIVARAILEAITPLVDPVLGPASFAYRPGLGVADAVQAVARLRDEGMGWVLRTDIDDCFPNVPVPHARRLLGALVDDQALLGVVDLLLARMYRSRKRGRRILHGLPQGCPLSPLLTNLVLTQVDADLLTAGFFPIRYADDIAVPTTTRDDASEALRYASESLRRLGMTLGAEDTAIMSFDEGFTFLGEDFGPRYPPVLDQARVDEPDRKVVYVSVQGGRVRTRDGRLIIETTGEQTALDIPTGHVARLVCFGAVGVSAGVRSWALASGVDVIFASRRGSYLGAFIGGSGSARPNRIRAQIAITDTTCALAISRAIIEAKIRKQIVILQRFGRRDDTETIRDAIGQMQASLAMSRDAATPEELMGLEGAAARAYFPAYGSLFPTDLQFTLRSRQPPRDVPNSALSFLYTVILGECVTALYTAGLDPAFGVLHTDHEDRPSLALDLLEEFRPWVVDQVVLELGRRGSLKSTHARIEEGRAGTMLTKAGRQAVLDGYEHRMLTRVGGALPGFSGTIRRYLYRQAQRLSNAITTPGEPFTGTSWR